MGFSKSHVPEMSGAGEAKDNFRAKVVESRAVVYDGFKHESKPNLSVRWKLRLDGDDEDQPYYILHWRAGWLSQNAPTNDTDGDTAQPAGGSGWEVMQQFHKGDARPSPESYEDYTGLRILDKERSIFPDTDWADVLKCLERIETDKGLPPWFDWANTEDLSTFEGLDLHFTRLPADNQIDPAKSKDPKAAAAKGPWVITKPTDIYLEEEKKSTGTKAGAATKPTTSTSTTKPATTTKATGGTSTATTSSAGPVDPQEAALAAVSAVLTDHLDGETGTAMVLQSKIVGLVQTKLKEMYPKDAAKIFPKFAGMVGPKAFWDLANESGIAHRITGSGGFEIHFGQAPE